MRTATVPANPLDDLSEVGVHDEYRRRALGELSDQQLVDSAAALIGVPRAEVSGDRHSFVLHAPLELLARAALLPLVTPTAREQARLRIVALVAGYQASGPPVDSPPEVDLGSRAEAATVLAQAIAAEDLEGADAAAAWLGRRVRPDEIVSLLADTVIDRLSAAGHGNIYLALLARTQPRGLPGQMLRHPVRALASGSNHRIHLPAARTAPDAPHGSADALLGAVARTEVIGPPPSFFIAPMVEHAQGHGVFERFVDDVAFTAPATPPYRLLRFAAQAMLQGPDEHVAFGWTHCLTLAQAPLVISSACDSPAQAVYVAAAYLAAHWAGLGRGTVDLEHVPEKIEVDVAGALQETPATAAAAAWHHPDRDETTAALTTSASEGEDTHRVKYTLACLDAAAADPTHRSLYLAAAAHLNAWWNQHR